MYPNESQRATQKEAQKTADEVGENVSENSRIQGDKASENSKILDEKASENSSFSNKNLSPDDIIIDKFVGKDKKTYALTQNIADEWKNTFGLNNINDDYIPKMPDEVSKIMNKEVKLTKGSLFKLIERGREKYLPQVKQTLDEPELILKETTKEGDVFIFAKQINGKQYFTSVGNDYDTHITIVSNAPKTNNAMKNKILNNAEVVYQSPRLENLRYNQAFTDERLITNKTDKLNSSANELKSQAKSKEEIKADIDKEFAVAVENAKKSLEIAKKKRDELNAQERDYMIKEARGEINVLGFNADNLEAHIIKNHSEKDAKNRLNKLYLVADTIKNFDIKSIQGANNAYVKFWVDDNKDVFAYVVTKQKDNYIASYLPLDDIDKLKNRLLKTEIFESPSNTENSILGTDSVYKSQAANENYTPNEIKSKGQNKLYFKNVFFSNGKMAKELFDGLTPKGALGRAGYEPAPSLDRTSKITKNSTANEIKNQAENFRVYILEVDLLADELQAVANHSHRQPDGLNAVSAITQHNTQSSRANSTPNEIKSQGKKGGRLSIKRG